MGEQLDRVMVTQREFNMHNSPLIGRTVSFNEAQLYKLCSELQKTMFIDTLEYRQMEHCKTALVLKNWPIAKASAPNKLFGMGLEFEGVLS